MSVVAQEGFTRVRDTNTTSVKIIPATATPETYKRSRLPPLRLNHYSTIPPMGLNCIWTYVEIRNAHLFSQKLGEVKDDPIASASQGGGSIFVFCLSELGSVPQLYRAVVRPHRQEIAAFPPHPLDAARHTQGNETTSRRRRELREASCQTRNHAMRQFVCTGNHAEIFERVKQPAAASRFDTQKCAGTRFISTGCCRERRSTIRHH